jgi:hypothetical protein
MFGANRVMGDVFVKISETQEKFEHAIALGLIRFRSALLKILHDSEGIGKEPLEAFRVNGLAGTTTPECVIGANESLIEEVIEAELFGREGARNDVGTRTVPATSR